MRSCDVTRLRGLNMSPTTRFCSLLVATILALALGCGDEDGGTGPGPTPAITITQGPTDVSVEQGGSITLAASLTRSGGYTGSVTFTVEGTPTGVTATVTAVETTGAVTTATITVHVDASVPPGTYDAILRAHGSGVTDQTVAFTLTVTAAPDYSLSADPDALTIQQGTTGQTSVTLSRTNFTGPVTLSLGNAPAGVTGAFDPAAPTGNTSTLTVTVGSLVAPGVYNLTVDGSASIGERDTPLTLTVTAAPDYGLSADPDALTIEQGTTGQTSVTLSRTNFTGPVTLSLGNTPAGVTGAFDPAAPTGNSSTLTVTVGSLVAPGVYNLTVDGSAGIGERDTPLTLTVTAAPASYSIALTPETLSIKQGDNKTTEVTLARVNFTGAVDLTVENAPAGVTASFDPTPATGDASTLTITVGVAVTLGQYTLTVRGVAAGLTDRTATLTLRVTDPAETPAWSFAVAGDPRDDTPTFTAALVEVRDMTTNPEPSFAPPEFITITGDIDPNRTNYMTYQTVAASASYLEGYYPVMGNHDFEVEAERQYLVDSILPEQQNITRYRDDDANYHLDWKNIRMIAVDAYSTLGEWGCINSTGLEWVESLIVSAVDADHIFITFHEPAFPRYRHVGDSFDACPEDRDAFWNMLMEHVDKVRAVFVAHTHLYYRMRVADPTSAAANDPMQFPDEPGGIYQVDSGAAGNGDTNTVVIVEVDGENVRFRVIDSPEGSVPNWRVIDAWEW